MKKLILSVIVAIFLFPSCTDVKEARKVLEDDGYEVLSVGGYGFFQCSEDDIYATKAVVWNRNKTKKIKVCVCSGWFKGSTIRR